MMKKKYVCEITFVGYVHVIGANGPIKRVVLSEDTYNTLRGYGYSFKLLEILDENNNVITESGEKKKVEPKTGVVFDVEEETQDQELVDEEEDYMAEVEGVEEETQDQELVDEEEDYMDEVEEESDEEEVFLSVSKEDNPKEYFEKVENKELEVNYIRFTEEALYELTNKNLKSIITEWYELSLPENQNKQSLVEAILDIYNS